MDIEEFGSTPIEADALALVEFGFAVIVGNALLLAGFCEANIESVSALLISVRDGAVLSRAKPRNQTYRLAISVRSFISASTAAIFSADDGWGRPSPKNDIL